MSVILGPARATILAGNYVLDAKEKRRVGFWATCLDHIDQEAIFNKTPIVKKSIIFLKDIGRRFLFSQVRELLSFLSRTNVAPTMLDPIPKSRALARDSLLQLYMRQ
jgi:hypothetical protein